MIMRGSTPRSLNFTGTLGILGLAAVLLPLSPTWAQKTGADVAPPKPVEAPSAENPKEPASDDLMKRADQQLLRAQQLLQAAQAAKQEADAGRSADKAPKEAEPKAGSEVGRYKQTLQNALLERYRDDKEDLQEDNLGVVKQEVQELNEVRKEPPERGGRDKQAADQARTARAAAEIARAKAAVDRARRQLQQAEERLAALQASRKSSTPPSADAPPRTRGQRKLFEKVVKPKPGSSDDAPAKSDKRIAEIEAALQKLMDEVKSLKGEPEKPR